MTTLTEADVEQIALEWLNTIGWTVTHGPDIAPDASTHERSGYDQVVLGTAAARRAGCAQSRPA